MSIKIKDPTTGEWIKQSTGGGVASWNDLPAPLPNSHLPEGYPYVEGGGEAVILEETTLESDDGGEMGIEDILPLVVGNTYKVTWNGTEYSCVAYEFDASSEGLGVLTVIGNGVNFGLADTGEPFVFIPVAAYGITLVLPMDGSETAVVKITESGETVHKMDNKFIDAEWMAKENVSFGNIFPETTVNLEWYSNYAKGDIDVQYFTNIKVGQNFTVTVDGTEYNTVSALNTISVFGTPVTVTYIGNLYWYGKYWSSENEFVNTGEPFCIACAHHTEMAEKIISAALFFNNGDNTTVSTTIKVDGDIISYTPLPIEYLPERALKKYYYFPIDIEDCIVPDNSGEDLWLYTAEASEEIRKAQIAIAEGYLVTGTDGGFPCLITSAFYDSMDGLHSIDYALFPEMVTFRNYSRRRRKGNKQLILASSTEGSTKQFKITVDDSGTLTAAEITL